MDNDWQRWMQEATRLTQAGRLAEATELLQRGLGGAAGHAPTVPAAQAVAEPWRQALAGLMASVQGGVAGHPPAPAGLGEVIDGCVIERPTETTSAPSAGRRAEAGPQATAGSFTSGSHSHAGLTRAYRLYLPPQAAGHGAGPLLVMLHGCTQDADDFALGTGMNTLAREQGVAVLYPAQSADANPQRCWQWFKHNHQQRGRGEAAWIADLTGSVLARHGLDAGRVFIAGLSAGGAMAANVAMAYPELYAALGVHSGLTAGAAGNLQQALSAMQGGASAVPRPAGSGVPTIVFHGDQDSTVHPRNGEQVIAAASGTDGTTTVQNGRSAGGRPYTRTLRPAAKGRPASEHWQVHGAGHAWSGGQAAGSFTDPAGPDASREMLRFFLGLGPAPQA